MNKFKALVAFIFFFLTALINEQVFFPGFNLFALLVLSGFLGLGIGDTLILKSFVNMGPGRTLLIFGFQPAFLGILGYAFLGQSLKIGHLVGIVFCILCLAILSVESRKKNKEFSLKYIAVAMCGIFFDSFGVMISRHCFESSNLLTSFNVNFFRIFGAALAYLILTKTASKKISIITGLKSITRKERLQAIAGAFLGTFISLSFFLKAIQVGNLAVVSAVSLTGVVFSSLFESIQNKKWPSKYFLSALCCFFIGMYFVFTLK